MNEKIGDNTPLQIINPGIPYDNNDTHKMYVPLINTN